MTVKTRNALLKEVIPSEAVLCDLFIAEMNQQPGWTCYPETAGFDVLVVHESGRQIGVEAKLQLNAKVAEQILPDHDCYGSGRPGPDHRLVIVRSITDANAGIAKMLEQLGVGVWVPRIGSDFLKDAETGEFKVVPTAQFSIIYNLATDARCAEPPRSAQNRHYRAALFDWNPEHRLPLPDAVPTLQAGIPAPVRMTPWKQAAIRVLARLRTQGYITTKEIASDGCSPSVWTQKWLDKSPERGKWLESDRMPALDQQHPELYAMAIQALRETENESTTESQ